MTAWNDWWLPKWSPPVGAARTGAERELDKYMANVYQQTSSCDCGECVCGVPEVPGSTTAEEFQAAARRVGQSTDSATSGTGSFPDSDERDVLTEAIDLLYGEREKHYGPPVGNLERIAAFWSAYLDAQITPHDVGVMMILLKQARQRRGYHRDSAVDTAGYARLLEVLADADA